MQILMLTLNLTLILTLILNLTLTLSLPLSSASPRGDYTIGTLTFFCPQFTSVGNILIHLTELHSK